MTFFVPGIPPSLNARLDWRPRARETAAWKDTALICLHHGTGGRWPKLEHVRLVLTLVSASARRRDPDNVATSAKPIIDAMVLAGVLPDDSFAVIEELVVRSERGPETGIRVDVYRHELVAA